MIAPDNTVPTPAKVPAQQEFAEIMAVLGVGEMHQLPAGAGQLTAKELIFVARLVSHGRMAQAATEAGYKGENTGVTASKLLRRPEVQAFYGRCIAQLAANANTIIARIFERSTAAHAEAMAAYQRMQEVDADELAVESETTTESQGAESSHTSTSTSRIRARELAAKDFIRFSAVADKADNLLASMLGKLNVNVTGEVKVVQVTRNALDVLASLRRQSITPAQVANN